MFHIPSVLCFQKGTLVHEYEHFMKCKECVRNTSYHLSSAMVWVFFACDLLVHGFASYPSMHVRAHTHARRVNVKSLSLSWLIGLKIYDSLCSSPS
jgi:hypothetical protein